MIDPRGRPWHVEVPTTRHERARGLLGRDGLPEWHAMLFERARSVHTFGMRFEIAALFLDCGLRVLEIARMPPGRLALPRPRARHLLEAPTDADLALGDVMRLA
ncbi:MAG TPA: DUF192 domain-containing protein [Actinomycetota bacterium]